MTTSAGRRKECMEQILFHIFEGKWKAKEKLPPERELAVMLGFSRGTVNQAVLELDRMGFLEIRPRKGILVCDFFHHPTRETLSWLASFDSSLLDTTLFQDFMDLRILIERECLRLAMERQESLMNEKMAQKIQAGLDSLIQEDSKEKKKTKSPNKAKEGVRSKKGRNSLMAEPELSESQQEYLNSFLQMKKLVKHWEEDIQALDSDSLYSFHEYLVQASGNRAYVLLFSSFEPMLRQLMDLHLNSGDNKPQILEYHQTLLKAMEDNDAPKSDEAILAALGDAKDDLKRTLIPRLDPNARVPDMLAAL